jgi:hypothetical protein
MRASRCQSLKALLQGPRSCLSFDVMAHAQGDERALWGLDSTTCELPGRCYHMINLQ